MANRRVVDGISTEERIAATFTAIQKSGERITLTEFARRAKVGYSTLCHEYRDWAERIRHHRDGARGRKTGGRRAVSPGTGEGESLIRQLRKELTAAQQERDELRQQVPALRNEVDLLRQANARLRGVHIKLQESLVTMVGEQRAEQILSRVVSTMTATSE